MSHTSILKILNRNAKKMSTGNHHGLLIVVTVNKFLHAELLLPTSNQDCFFKTFHCLISSDQMSASDWLIFLKNQT